MALVGRPFSLFCRAGLEPALLFALARDFSRIAARRSATAEMSPINASVLL